MGKKGQPWEPKWAKGERLGTGGQARTYHATLASAPDERAVLKILKNNKSGQSRARMRREVVSLDTLAKVVANVPRVLDDNTEDYNTSDVQLYVVMDYIPGDTLSEVVTKRNGLPLEEAARIALVLCRAIQTGHENEVLHRDLKPDNVIVRNLDKDDIVILDYGLSFNSEEEQGLTDTTETFRNKFLDLPETNTPGGNRRDPRSDITAVCGIFYFCLTAQVPGQLQGADGRPPHMRPGFSLKEKLQDDPRVGQLEVFFNCGFSPNLESRFQTVQECVDRLSASVAPTATDEMDDPIAVAEEVSRHIRQQDRTTQLKDFETNAEALLNDIQRYVSGLQGKLGRLQLAATQVGRPRTQEVEQCLKCPGDIDLIGATPLVIQIMVQHHASKVRSVAYQVGARGEQCVLLQSECSPAPHSNLQEFQAAISAGRIASFPGPQNFVLLPESTSKWEHVFWFDGDTKADSKLVIDDFQRWLNASMRELGEEIAS